MDHDPQPQLRNTLTNRHVTMIALGGVIGAGLFVSSGAVLNTVGPAALLSYILSGVLVTLIMRAVGEMAVLLPEARSIENYPRIGLGRWAGFSVGWMYWYFWVIVAAVEAVAGAGIVGAFLPDVPNWALCLGLIVVMTLLNVISVRIYAETEFWLASIKIVAIVFFLVVGVVFLLDLFGHSPGLSHLTHHGGFFPAGGGAVVVGSVTVLFSFAGAEIATIAAAESRDPAKYAARATRQVTYRILFFYVLSIAVIICLVPWNTPMSGAQVRSPFALALSAVGIPYADVVMEVVVLTAVLSSLNSCLYLTSRVLFSLSRHGDAPTFLTKVNRRKVPARAIVAATIVSYLSVIANYFFPEQVFLFLINSSGAVCLIYYFLLVLAQVTVRRRFSKRGIEPKFRMWGHPWLSYLTMAWIVGVLVFMAINPDTRWELLLSGLSFAVVLAAYQIVRRRTTGRPAPEA
ncbi:amino acid permease [Kocuria sp. HSID16901]|uniref:amino acid permease n=1 Tax=Kocuria sp. HSID16901 TaxID=2419505 RepID=UPI0006600E41|nr:amino acid permease [Kocuria sp. HSID16901]RUQ20054.1 amino acid permease [Kocuria sp. HSID16901]